MDIKDLPQIRPIAPMKRPKPFDDRDWLFELKYDGFRAVAYFEKGRCRLISRQGKRLRFPKLEQKLAEHFKSLGIRSAILDGEACSLNAEGRPIFKDLIKLKEPIAYVAFDLMWIDGKDLRDLPLRERKKLLRRVVRKRARDYAHIREAFSVRGKGCKLFALTLKHDLEGMVAKRLDGTYSRRTRWYKTRNPQYTQDATRPRMERHSR
ncbi:MAG: ATP-dependent ligase LigD phosphoesterase module / ATP-dependent ligase LigD polymerase [Candidatus Taylorbacteria bacterium]|nr:ATP-dependent ligase LigD phosphoesterase module / ATP-dependent ligase LigD polymerase [Candidatus Taylorbacteria bacterium]